jgi:hypothetical protein
MEPHYTVEDLSKIFRYDPQTIRKMIKEGRIHAFRLGKGKKSPYRIMPEEVGRLREVGFEEQMEELKASLSDIGNQSQ